jgi:methylglutamate dehydrogenase subunit B
MRINCPYCGERSLEEFVVQGEVPGPRPTDGNMEAMHNYVHLRANEWGPTKEFWYHANGCRRWLIVSRDTRDHSILDVRFASGASDAAGK